MLLKCSFSFNLRDRYVLGGVHLTNLAFLPNALLKEITATEYKRSITSFYNNHFALAEKAQQKLVLGSCIAGKARQKLDQSSSVNAFESLLGDSGVTLG